MIGFSSREPVKSGRRTAARGRAAIAVLAACMLSAAAVFAGLRHAGAAEDESPAGVARPGGDDASVVQVANLVYARSKSSKCFADHFLLRAEQESRISTSRRFHAVKLSGDDLFNYPFVIMTGEGAFSLPEDERRNLRAYLDNGGFLLASAGCSSKEWDKSFRKEVQAVFKGASLEKIGFEHPVFHTIYDIKKIEVRHGKPQAVEGLVINGRLAILYSSDGLNDTGHVKGCCCCGGNEITNCEEINVNVLAYALTF